MKTGTPAPYSRRLLFLAAAFASPLLLAPVSRAAAANWTGLTDGVWSLNTNWSGSATPDGTYDLTILGPGNVAGALNINIDAAASANSISFTNTAATTLTNTTSGASQTLTLGSGGLTVGSGTVTIGSVTANQGVNIALAASQIWNIGAGGLTASNVISGSGFGLTKSGSGTLTLSGANTFTGGVTLNAGTLLVQGSTTPASGTVTGGALGTGTLTLNGGTFGFAAGASYTIANNVNVTGATNLQVASATNEVLNGNWSGGGNLTLIANGSTGQWQFGGDNSGYTGTFTQNGGNTSLTFNSTSSGSAAAAWVFNNGTTERTRFAFGNGTIKFGSLTGSGALANIGASGTVATVEVGALNTSTTFGGTLKNGGTGGISALTKVGTGTLTLTGANTYTGATTVNAGTLALGAANRIGDTSVLVMNGGTFATGGFSETLNTLTVSANSIIDFGSGTSALVFSDSGALAWNGTLTLLNFDIGVDSLRFGTTGIVGTALTTAQLNSINLAGYTASLDSSGFVTFSAIPEPSTYAAFFGLLAFTGAVVHRRSR